VSDIERIREQAWQVEPLRRSKLFYSKKSGLTPVGECLCCGLVMALAAWKDEPLGQVTHGVCGPCLEATASLRGPYEGGLAG
jgi:hypothetical protein